MQSSLRAKKKKDRPGQACYPRRLQMGKRHEQMRGGQIADQMKGDKDGNHPVRIKVAYREEESLRTLLNCDWKEL